MTVKMRLLWFYVPRKVGHVSYLIIILMPFGDKTYLLHNVCCAQYAILPGACILEYSDINTGKPLILLKVGFTTRDNPTCLNVRTLQH